MSIKALLIIHSVIWLTGCVQYPPPPLGEWPPQLPHAVGSVVRVGGLEVELMLAETDCPDSLDDSNCTVLYGEIRGYVIGVPSDVRFFVKPSFATLDVDTITLLFSDSSSMVMPLKSLSFFGEYEYFSSEGKPLLALAPTSFNTRPINIQGDVLTASFFARVFEPDSRVLVESKKFTLRLNRILHRKGNYWSDSSGLSLEALRGS